MIINIWAQWCAPCREEAPFLADVAAKNRSRTLILGIDYADPRPDYAIEFAQLTGWTYPQLVDAETVLKVPLQLGAGAPQTLFVTADGEIVHRKAGALHSAQELRDLAKEHLGVTL
jgi:thiol-disulfide isomerase/thioredoxin